MQSVPMTTKVKTLICARVLDLTSSDKFDSDLNCISDKQNYTGTNK